MAAKGENPFHLSAAGQKSSSRNRPGKLIPTNSAACCVERVKKAHTQTSGGAVSKVLCVCIRVIPDAAASENGFGNRGERKKLDQPQLAAGDRSGLVLQTIVACTLFLFLFAEREEALFNPFWGRRSVCVLSATLLAFFETKSRHALKINI